MFININNKSYLAGIHSFTASKTEKAISNYGDLQVVGRVSSYIEWIKNIISTK